jgi:hypothetical protein
MFLATNLFSKPNQAFWYRYKVEADEAQLFISPEDVVLTHKPAENIQILVRFYKLMKWKYILS